MKKPTAYPVIIIGIFLIFIAGFVIQDYHLESDEWEVPERFKRMENPVEWDTQSLRIGRSLFRRNCKECHGSEGKGDGSEAADLETELSDFTSEEFQNQTDGALFYKTREGRDEMPGFEADLYDEDIWHIVNYVRSLKEEQES